MKILFLDSRKDVRQNWVDPLRAQGWGVILAHSADEASKLMALHEEGLEAIVVHESLVGFAEKSNKPFIVLTETWSERDVAKHQSSSKSARGYLSYKGSPMRLIGIFNGKSAEPEKASPSVPEEDRTRIKLVDATQFLKRPEHTRTKATSSLSLRSPSKTISGRSTSTAIKAIQGMKPSVETGAEPEVQEVQEIPIEYGQAAPSFETVEPTRIQPILREEGTQFIQPTRMIERTSAAVDMQISPLEESADPFTYDSPVESVRREVDSYFDRAPEPRPALKLVTESDPDVEALRNYLAMREQDVAVLNGQIRSSKERLSQVEAEWKTEKVRNAELEARLSKAEQTIKNYDLEKRVDMEVVEKQVEDLDRQLRERTEKARAIETKLRLMTEEVGKIKERVRVDIRRIRVREKELEAQLEILRKDSAALLQARDEKILELKRKVDLLEFNMELAQEQVEKERRSTDELKSKLRDAADAMKQANGYLEQ